MSESAGRACGALGALAIVLVALSGLRDQAAVPAPRSGTPVVAGQDAASFPGRLASLPIDDLTDGRRPARGVADVTVMDTRSFAEPIQRVVVPEGAPLHASEFLPPHTSPPIGRRLGTARSAIALGGVGGEERVTLDVGFAGMSDTGWNPPDPTLAVGPGHVVTTVNSHIAFYTKSGTLQFMAPLGSQGSPGFFEDVGAGSFAFDPKCFYDHFDDRFVVLALEVYGQDSPTTTDDAAFVVIGVSDDSDPNGVWYKYRTNAITAVGQTNHWWDYPGLACDDDAYYVTGNLFGLSVSSFAGAGFRIFDKADMLGGLPATYSTIRDGNLSSVQCAQLFGANANPLFACFRFFDVITLTTITDPLTSPAITNADIGVPSTDLPSDAPNPGGSVSVVGPRLMNAHARDGYLYTCHTLWDSDRATNVARWYEFFIGSWPASGGPVLAQAGEVSLDPGVHSFFPAIYTDDNRHAALVCAGSASGQFVSMHVTARRSDDPSGDMAAPTQVALGSAGSSGRWGDYYDMALDPSDDLTLWAIGETETASGWATRIQSFRVIVPPPACFGDFNADNLVDVFDFNIFATNFGTLEGATPEDGDLDDDGDVDVFDFNAFAFVFGDVCSPS